MFSLCSMVHGWIFDVLGHLGLLAGGSFVDFRKSVGAIVSSQNQT